MNVFYASALLVPCWKLMTLCLYAGPVALDNVVHCSSVDVLKGWLDSLSFWLPQCWGVPVKQLGVFPHLFLVLEHICAGGRGVV